MNFGDDDSTFIFYFKKYHITSYLADPSKVAHMPTVLDGDEMVIAHGKSKFLAHDKVAKLIREAGGCLGSSVNLIKFLLQVCAMIACSVCILI